MVIVHRNVAIALLSYTVLGSGELYAQARGPSRFELGQSEKVVDAAKVDAARAKKLAELSAWLKRLVGRFHYEGYMVLFTGAGCRGCGDIGGYLRIGDLYYLSRAVTGVGDCKAFGTGPGVHCAISVPWPAPAAIVLPVGGRGSVNVRPWPGPSLDPAMILYGIDPDSLAIRMLVVDGHSIALSMLGVLQGDTATFKMDQRVFWIRALPGGKRVEFIQKTGFPNEEYSFHLSRVTNARQEDISRSMNR